MLPSDIRSLTEAYQSIYAPKEETVEITEELLDEAFDELVDEFIEEGYEEEEALAVLEEATDAYLEEAKVTFGSDTTPMRASGARVGARRRYGRRKAGEVLKAAGEKAKSAADTVKKKAAGAVASAQIAGSIAKDEARRAGRAAQHSVTKAADAAKRAPGEAKKRAKSGIKGFIKRQAEKVVKRMSEETIQEADSIAAMRERAAKRRKQRYGASDTSRGGRDDFRPYTKADYERGEANDPRKKVKEELELDQMIESLVERGHTEQEAYALVAQFTLDEAQQLDEISLKTKMSAFKKRATDEFETDGDNPRNYTKSGASKADKTKANIVKKHGEKAGQHAERAAHTGIFGRKSFSMPKKPTNEEFVGEAQEARNNPEKYEREQSKKYAPVRGEKTPMPPRGDKRREDFEKWYAAQRR